MGEEQISTPKTAEEKKPQAAPKKKKDGSNVQMIFSAIVFTVLFILELYVMINYPKDYIMLGVFGVLILIALYFVIASIQKKSQRKEVYAQEQYEMIFKSEKASYMMLKKSFDDLEKRMGEMEQTASVPADNIISAQKAIAKVTINRNRENAEALLNSNDQVMDMLESFGQKLHVSNEELMEKQKTLIIQNNQELLLKQQELLTNISGLENYIKTGVIQAMENAKEMANQASAMTQQMAAQQSMSQFTSQAAAPEVKQPDPQPVMETVQPELSQPVAEEIPAQSVQESVTTTVPEMAASEQTPVEPVMEEAAVSEPEEEAIPDVEEASLPEPDESEAEPVVDEAGAQPAAPDMSDPNKMMTPEEIAALIASM